MRRPAVQTRLTMAPMGRPITGDRSAFTAISQLVPMRQVTTTVQPTMEPAMPVRETTMAQTLARISFAWALMLTPATLATLAPMPDFLATMVQLTTTAQPTTMEPARTFFAWVLMLMLATLEMPMPLPDFSATMVQPLTTVRATLTALARTFFV